MTQLKINAKNKRRNEAKRLIAPYKKLVDKGIMLTEKASIEIPGRKQCNAAELKNLGLQNLLLFN
jgi:hypothetical protein